MLFHSNGNSSQKTLHFKYTKIFENKEECMSGLTLKPRFKRH